ncbi:MAG: sugar phosphate isomerase/epimerase [Clostridia bacterium]|nr:sugar phosphate isomerase/epimerase [Clostridia bacterium]
MKLCAFADEASPRLDGQIEALRRNGISLLEIRGVDGRNIKDLTPDDAKEVKKRLDDAGIAVWSVGSPMGKHSLAEDFAPHFDDFCRVTELAHILGASRIRMFSFYPAPGAEPERTREEAFARLRRFVEATPEDVILCHENEKEIYGEGIEACLSIHREFSSLRAVFDPANFVQCGVDTLAAWDALAPYVDYMHIKDALTDGTVVPAGKGDGNVAELIRRYAAKGGEVLTLEPHLTDFVGLGGLERGGVETRVGKYAYATNDEAFDAAVSALKAILNM